jgi:LacI family transcriptional regulator
MFCSYANTRSMMVGIQEVSMTTLRALASQLGLSITTVSRALDGYEDVAKATRERVRKAADLAGYRPNAAARRLRKGSGETIAVVMPTEAGKFFEPVFAELLGVVGESLAAHNHDLVLLAAKPGVEEDKLYTRLVTDRRADGFILLRTRVEDARIAYLREAKVPFVCHGRSVVDGDYAFVDGDGETGFYDVTRRLIGLGHKRLVHIGAPGRFAFARYRAEGFTRALDEAGMVAVSAIETSETMTEAGGEAVAAQILGRSAPPTALICATDRLAIGAIRAATARGMVVGRDIAITGHDNLHASAFTAPPLTTMDADVRMAGQRLAKKILTLMARKSPDETGEILPLTHILRASSGEGK